MRWCFGVAVLFPAPALACSMIWMPPDPGLPGEVAGPEAVFSTARGSDLLDADENVIPTTRTSLTTADSPLELLVPDAPLAAGTYWMDGRMTTIAEGEGDPGVPPAAPEITTERIRIPSGQRADCGPKVPATRVAAETDAVGVLFAAEPVDLLAGTELIGAVSSDSEGGIRWTTTEDVEVYAAAIDAEGEISDWVGPFALESSGCSTVAGRHGTALAALLAAAALRRRTPSRPGRSERFGEPAAPK